MTPVTSPFWDAEGLTVLYATPQESDAMTMIAIRANITESGWDTIALIEAARPNARAHARWIAALPHLLGAVRAVASDPDACTCHTRGWYGRDHDTQCPIRIARDALAQANPN